ncbi:MULTISPECIES: ABC-F family ATP-binding cassette domain-containing protein [unclassified Bacteroides]|jgi:ATP-binding cassette subfamily F protein 3|uniref:ABC-F family ATP-binding cassette domain-containing protein n=1 Tax=unclassified Bacteroides TaxID=2646097 RepID=UPI000E92AE4A|nr:MULTISPECIES: ABC-F family ATP-binding cassette domain-containing protein [unclassified Bacteroides]RGN43705.1 ABC transporter ATP-binding protein [Bacteroides sp. OM05-12]RHR71243.1 ABC transporter ATP-binding protein [Bacteroides sp. AF16-49]
MISVENLYVEFSATPLLEEVTFVINKRDRIALVGKNGAGKSTMLKILAGMQLPTSGNVAVPKDITIGYLPQVMILSDEHTVMEEAELAFEHIFELQAGIQRMNQELAERTDYDSESYHKLIDRFTHENERFLMMGGTNYRAEIERTLMGLGFKREDFDRSTSEFSGGWRMRIELAKLLLRRPDVLLLDEPTNHLDIESIQWLENFLKSSANAVVLVSHDRAFINNVTTRTIEINCRRIYDYKVAYDQFVVLRKERREQQLRAYENQQKQIQDTEDFIERFRYKATKAVQVQSRIKQLEKIVPIEVDEEDNSALRLKFPPAPRSGSYPVIAENLKKAYGNHVVFHDVDLTINRGEKVAFVGKNGEGKSTLVKCIMGEIDYEGKLTIGHNVMIGYFAQNQAQLLDENLTVFDTIDYVAQGDIRTKIRDILGAFMFGGEASDKKVKVLSGGERSRLAMIKLLLEPVNLLILDEPTNHLDMRSKDVLKDAIREFEGTVIVVSHDRDFLDGLVTKVYEFGGGVVKEHLGGIYDFLQKKKIENLNELQRKPELSESPTAQNDEPAQVSENKLSYEAQKELNKKLRKLEKQVSDCEKEIEVLEKKIAVVEEQMTTPEGASDMSLYEQHQQLKKQMNMVVEEWENTSMELEELQNTN